MSKVIQKFPAVYAGNRILDVLDFKIFGCGMPSDTWNYLKHWLGKPLCVHSLAVSTFLEVILFRQ